MTDKQGLYGKYTVTKTETGELVTNCFILRPDKDEAAVKALQTYAAETPDKKLADDLYMWVGRPLQKPLMFDQALAMLNNGDHVWIEERHNTQYSKWAVPIGKNSTSVLGADEKQYGKTFRAWSHRPTEEERSAAPWKE